MEIQLIVLAAAIILDLIAGDPDAIWRRIPHPVVFFGDLISLADKSLNSPKVPMQFKRSTGVLAITALIVLSIIVGYGILIVLEPLGYVGLVFEIVIISIFIAQKSLSDHVRRIISPLQISDLCGARSALSMIVGRETKNLDQSDISRAAIESLSENYSDGVVAPIFWCALFGLPGIFAYKMLNTADSMIGHKNEKYLHFGWASAKLDDIANWIPARISSLIIALSSMLIIGPDAARKAIRVAFSEARFHQSPNAGWPEGAMAGALDISLSGPRIYEGKKSASPFINAGGRGDLSSHDIINAIKIYRCACFIGLAMVGAAFILS